MKSISESLRLGRTLRVVGFDDAPFDSARDASVHVAGVICADTRFEGMLWGHVKRDGIDATQVLSEMLGSSKFADQVNVVLIDGIALAGFNIIDIPLLADLTRKPCIAVMRRQPDMSAIDRALQNFTDYSLRKRLLGRGGNIFHHPPFYFQVAGCTADEAAAVLTRLTDTGHVPEALRIAHLIGAAIKTGQSSNRA